MKAIMSSRELSLKLDKIDFDEDRVIKVSSNEGQLNILTSKSNITILCEVSENKSIDQENNRWDWLKRLVYQIEEQPIVLDLDNNKLNIIISY